MLLICCCVCAMAISNVLLLYFSLETIVAECRWIRKKGILNLCAIRVYVCDPKRIRK